MSAINEMGDGEHFCKREFEECFEKVDADGNGEIDQNEMLEFIQSIAGAETKKEIDLPDSIIHSK